MENMRPLTTVYDIGRVDTAMLNHELINYVFITPSGSTK